MESPKNESKAPRDLSRRQFLRLLASAGAISPLLAACGAAPNSGGVSAPAATSGPVTVNQNATAVPAPVATAAPAGSAGGTFIFS